MRKKARLFCLDKDSKSIKALVYLLKSNAYHVLAATTKLKALEAIQNESALDLAICNSIHLGAAEKAKAVSVDDEHLVVVRQLRKKFPDLPVLFVVPQMHQKLIETYAAVGNAELLFPPFEPSYFLFVVKTGLEGGFRLIHP